MIKGLTLISTLLIASVSKDVDGGKVSRHTLKTSWGESVTIVEKNKVFETPFRLFSEASANGESKTLSMSTPTFQNMLSLRAVTSESRQTFENLELFFPQALLTIYVHELGEVYNSGKCSAEQIKATVISQSQLGNLNGPETPSLFSRLMALQRIYQENVARQPCKQLIGPWLLMQASAPDSLIRLENFHPFYPMALLDAYGENHCKAIMFAVGSRDFDEYSCLKNIGMDFPTAITYSNVLTPIIGYAAIVRRLGQKPEHTEPLAAKLIEAGIFIPPLPLPYTPKTKPTVPSVELTINGQSVGVLKFTDLHPMLQDMVPVGTCRPLLEVEGERVYCIKPAKPEAKDEPKN